MDILQSKFDLRLILIKPRLIRNNISLVSLPYM